MDILTVKMIAEQANSIISQNDETYGGYSNVNFEGGTGHLIVDLKGDGVKDDIMISIKQFRGLFVADTSRAAMR